MCIDCSVIVQKAQCRGWASRSGRRQTRTGSRPHRRSNNTKHPAFSICSTQHPLLPRRNEHQRSTSAIKNLSALAHRVPRSQPSSIDPTSFSLRLVVFVTAITFRVPPHNLPLRPQYDNSPRRLQSPDSGISSSPNHPPFSPRSSSVDVQSSQPWLEPATAEHRDASTASHTLIGVNLKIY